MSAFIVSAPSTGVTNEGQSGKGKSGEHADKKKPKKVLEKPKPEIKKSEKPISEIKKSDKTKGFNFRLGWLFKNFFNSCFFPLVDTKKTTETKDESGVVKTGKHSRKIGNRGNILQRVDKSSDKSAERVKGCHFTIIFFHLLK